MSQNRSGTDEIDVVQKSARTRVYRDLVEGGCWPQPFGGCWL